MPLKRWTSAILIGGVSIVLSFIFSSEGRAVDFLQNFLLFLVYWVMPWFGVQAVEFYINKRVRIDNVLDFYRPIGHALKGADLSYFVSAIVAGGLYYLFHDF